jgi:transglutaminase-like putative cysteine protease
MVRFVTRLCSLTLGWAAFPVASKPQTDYQRHGRANTSSREAVYDVIISTVKRAIPTRSSLVLSVVVLGVLTYAPTLVRAQQGFQPVSPEELKMISEPLAPGAPAIILYRQVDRDDNTRTPHEDNYLRIKILTEEGRKYADIEIPFLKQNQDVIHIRARTIRPDGSIVEFDGQVFEKALVKSRGLKYLAKTFTLPDVQVGGIIEYLYTVDMKENFIYDSHWILNEELFTKRARFSLKPFMSTSNTFNLRWTWQALQPGSEPKQDPADRYHTVRIEATNIAAFQTEDFMPPANELKSRVDFIYDRELYAKDADTYWKRIGKERNSQLESFIGKRKAMEEAVAQIVSPNDPPETKLRKIYDRVQQLRNTSYEVQKTEQEEKRDKTKTAENVEDVWKRGYGNGVQLTWLFLALVRAAGLEAYGCLVSDRSNYFFFLPRPCKARNWMPM